MVTTYSYVQDGKVHKQNLITLNDIRPNLNSYSNWFAEYQLKKLKGAKARFLRSCLDSGIVKLLGNKNLLFRALLNSYSHCILPFHAPLEKRFQSIACSQKEAVEVEQAKCDIIQ